MTALSSNTRILSLLTLLMAWLAPWAAAKPQSKSGPPPAIAFVHVNVIPMDRQAVLEDQTVIIAGDKIAALGPAAHTPIPRGARKIAARGKYLIPGLTDAHVHLQTPGEFPLYLANGVTTVFNLDGRPAHLLWRKKIAGGELLGPAIITSGPIFVQAPSAEEAVRRVDEQAALGYDAVKIYNGVSKEAYPALIAEAKRKHLLLMGHVARKPDFELTLSSGQSIAHLEEYTYTFFNPLRDSINSHIVYDESRIPEAVRLTVQAGIYVTPTLSTYSTIVQQATALDDFLKRPELRYDPPWIQSALQPATNRYKNGFEPSFYPRIRTSLALQRKLLKALADAGVPLLCGTDASDVGPVAGFGVHEELQEFVNDGLTPYQALQTATVNAARYFGRSAEFASITPGKRADMVLLSANPLAEIANTRAIDGVMVRGRWLEKKELAAAVENVPSSYAQKVRALAADLHSNPGAALLDLEENDPFDHLASAVLAEMVRGQNVGELRKALRELRQTHPSARLASEQSVNTLGYSLLGQKQYPEAMAVFLLNTEDFPKSANTWDSLGEALFNSGDLPHALDSYRRALEVDPHYPNAEFANKFLTDHQPANK